jgi:uncharacterized protein
MKRFSTADNLRRPMWSRGLHGVVECPKFLLLGLVKTYRLLLKPWLGQACRFEPSCSQYALDALERHGAVVGASLTSYRLLRCHPWCNGGCDPVPDQPPALFSRLGLVPPASRPKR